MRSILWTVRFNPSRPCRRILMIVALAVLITPALLFAHAHLVRSEPAADAVLSSPPTEIRLWFSEEPDIRFSRIDLNGPKGKGIELGAMSAISSNGLRVPIPARLAPGTYVIFWRTAASDGHASNGRLHFTVRADSAAAVPPAAVPTITPPANVDTTVKPHVDTSAARKRPQSNAVITTAANVTTSTALRWAEFVALLTVIGAIVFRLAILPAARWPEDLVAEASDRARRLAVALAILFLIATVTRALAQSQLLTQLYASRLAALQALVTTTRWGLAWGIGAAGAILALVGLLAARAGLGGWIAAAVGIVLVTVSEALTGHSGSSAHVSLAMAMDVAHQLGAGGWVGGLTCVVLAGVRTTRRLDEPDARFAGVQLVRSYHRSAVECVALVVISGIVAAALRLHAVSELWTTPYGSMLFRKLVFVALVLAIGYYHWRRVVIPDWNDGTRARFTRSATLELIVGAVVVAFTALLVASQLPR